MNGPEHYETADNLLNDLAGYDQSDPDQRAETQLALQFAQVHATLALTAAVFDTKTVDARYGSAWERAVKS